MKKIMIRTYDCFITDDYQWDIAYSNWCYDVAKICGLDAYKQIFKKDSSNRKIIELHLEGPKWNIVKYYMRTIGVGKGETKFQKIMRIFDMIFTF